jgi:hypothetical protein
MAFFRIRTSVGLSVLSALCLTSTAALARDVSFSDCGQGEVKAVRVENCGDGACSVASGSAVQVDIDFVSGQDVRAPVLEGQVDVSGLLVSLPGVETDGCKSTQCPVRSGGKTSVHLEVSLSEVSASLPPQARETVSSARPEMHVRVVSPSGEPLACVRIPFKLVPEMS